MRVLQLALFATAGMPYRLHEAIAAAGHESTLVNLKPGVFPGDVVDPSWRDALRLIDEADIIHVHGLSLWGLLEPELRDRSVLVHVHGEPDRGLAWHPRGLRLVVATPDLLADYPDAIFVPNIVLSEDLPPSAPLGETLRVFKSPSLHDKHRGVFERFMAPLVRSLSPRVEYIAPEEIMPMHDLVRLRATCHISLDHLHGYYGLESLEALAQGLIAVNGATVEALDQVASVVGAPPPFAVAHTPAALGDLLVRLVEEALSRPEVFERRRARGPRYMARYYGVEGLTRIWLRLYRAALGELAWPLPGRPLTVEEVQAMRGNLHPLPKAV